MGQRIAGTCYFKVDGEQLDLSGDIETNLFDTKKESVKSISGVTGYYKEEDVVPMVKGSFLVPSTFPLDLLDQDNITITVELANGMVRTISGAYQVGDASFKGNDGTVDLEFNGQKGIWQ